MQNTFKAILAACASTLFVVAACSTAPVETADAKPDVRQGAEVRNICFGSQIRNWRPNDRQSVIVEASSRKEYKLDLMGGCDPDSAFMSIGLISRFGGGSCLDVGDTLVTDTRYANDICRIQKIYEWNKDAKPASTEAPSAS